MKVKVKKIYIMKVHMIKDNTIKFRKLFYRINLWCKIINGTKVIFACIHLLFYYNIIILFSIIFINY